MHVCKDHEAELGRGMTDGREDIRFEVVRLIDEEIHAGIVKQLEMHGLTAVAVVHRRLRLLEKFQIGTDIARTQRDAG